MLKKLVKIVQRKRNLDAFSGEVYWKNLTFTNVISELCSLSTREFHTMPDINVGIDSLKVELGAKPNIFEGLLGIAVTCRDEEGFIKAYRQCMSQSLTQAKINTTRIVLKAYDISRLVEGQEKNFLVSFLDSMNDVIERIDIFYTRYNPKKLPKISMYGEDQPITKNPVEFLRTIANRYPHACGYWYFSIYSSQNVSRMYLDHFDTCHTPAWESLSKFKNLSVLYKGSNCNCLLSLADLLARLTATEVKTKGEDFNREGFERIHSAFPWTKKVVVHDLGGSTQILKSITPKNRRSVDLTDYIARPMVFVPLESLVGLRGANEERNMFENLPIFNDLSNFLFFTKGSFKYFEPSEDVGRIRKGDFLLVLGKNSQDMYKYLKQCGSELEMLTPSRLKKENSKFIN